VSAAAPDLEPGGPSEHDRERVRALLGREPQGRYTVVVRDEAGDPVVLRNAPLLDDGTPMPTRYWLVGSAEIRRIGQLESDGGVDAAEAAVDPAELAAAHARYAAERDADIPADHQGPRPSGGVGGTRTGVKCLHAHWAWHLAGGDDPIGRWIAARLDTLHLDLADDATTVTIRGRATLVVPWGARTLTERWLADGDPPPAASLTNALGAFDDHLDDAERLAEQHAHARDGALDRIATTFAGPTITSLACVELGHDAPPATLTIDRATAEELFRTLATERAADRAHNPGLPFDHVERIVATCCIVVATMRHFHLDQVDLVCGER
jgi:uncharacterized protein